jgi:hypothetical protein
VRRRLLTRSFTPERLLHSLDAELARLTANQLIAVLDCLEAEALRARTAKELLHARTGFMVVRAELLSREFMDSQSVDL